MSTIKQLLENYFHTSQSLHTINEELKKLYLVSCKENEKETQDSIFQLIVDNFMGKSFEVKRDFLYSFFIFDLPFYHYLWKNEIIYESKKMAALAMEDPECAVRLYYMLYGKIDGQFFIPKIIMEFDEIITKEFSKIKGFKEEKNKFDLEKQKEEEEEEEILSSIDNSKEWKGDGQKSIINIAFKFNCPEFIKELNSHRKNHFVLLFNNFNDYLNYQLKHYDFYDLFNKVEYKNEDLSFDLNNQEIVFSLELNTLDILIIEQIKKSLHLFLVDFFQKNENNSFRFEDEIISLLLN